MNRDKCLWAVPAWGCGLRFQGLQRSSVGEGGCGCSKPEQNSWGGGRRGSWPGAAAGEGRAGPWSHQPCRLDQTNIPLGGPQGATFRTSRGRDRAPGLLSTAPQTDLRWGGGGMVVGRQGRVFAAPPSQGRPAVTNPGDQNRFPQLKPLSQGEAETYLPLIGLSSCQLSHKPQGQAVPTQGQSCTRKLGLLFQLAQPQASQVGGPCGRFGSHLGPMPGPGPRYGMVGVRGSRGTTQEMDDCVSA